MVRLRQDGRCRRKNGNAKPRVARLSRWQDAHPFVRACCSSSPDATVEDVRRFGEECQRRQAITPLQIFLHKDEGHWLGGEPAPDDKESFQIGGRWFKPNYHAHIMLIGWTTIRAKSRKLNDDDMTQMQTLVAKKFYQCSEDNQNQRQAKAFGA